MSRYYVLASLLFVWLTLGESQADTSSVRVGLDLEIGDVSSTSDEAIRLGAEQAIEEINRAGGVLNGRPLELVIRDNRSVPARGVANLREFAEMPELVAVMTGKFSPVALEQVRALPETRVVLLDPWAAADGIINNGQNPNWAFRLSLSDSMAVAAVLRQVKRDGFRRLGVLLPNIAWGRSNHDALKALAPKYGITLSGAEWYNWGGDASLMQNYVALRQAGAQVVFLVANEREGAFFVRELAKLPVVQRLPVISHWGITGGDFPKMCGDALNKVDLRVVQTYAFSQARNERAKRLAEAARHRFSVEQPDSIPSPVGVAHAYDLIHLLGRAINLAGSTERMAIRAALENLPAHDGVVKRYPQPFTAKRHEALSESDLFFARYGADGRLSPSGKP
ncbi:ABC transporter substrate-binding protein [Azonexus sp. IMCC34839]|uniref:ABC transporter substrate-binding protein n=1 Tax=Azonexus sp. IMCC34839 TaxID=3133695 RepID=UPI00399AA47C